MPEAITNLFAIWKTVLITAGIGLLLGAGVTWRVMSWEHQAGQVQQAKTTFRYLVGQSKINMQMGDIVFPKIAAAEAHTDHVQQEIPQHVTPEIDRDFPLPLGIVRVWNDASHGTIPPATAGSDADPSGIPPSALAAAGAADEGTLDKCRIALGAWWAWYDSQAELWNKSGNSLSAK